MREFKFRAWDKTTKVMIREYARTGSYGELYTVSFHSDAYSEKGCPNLIIMQYVGIKDKNGKDIYEGDIISYHYNDSKDHDSEIIFKKEVVEWDERYFGFHPFVYNEIFYIKVIEREVIGNIYENPELIKNGE